MTAAVQPAPIAPSRSRLTAADIPRLLRALGDVPAERVLLNPSPGTATEADVVRLVDGDEKRLCELVDGILVEKAMGYRPALVAAAVISSLRTFVIPRNLGIVAGAQAMLRMTGGNVRLPDVSYTSWADIPEGSVPDVAVADIPATLAVEVLSEGNMRKEMEKKYREFFASGTRLVWEIDPDRRTASVFDPADPTTPREVLTAEQSLDGGDVLPGFSLSLKELFAELDRSSPRREG